MKWLSNDQNRHLSDKNDSSPQHQTVNSSIRPE